MAKSILYASVLQNETAAYAWVEARVWPNGPVCPHCGGVDRISKMQGKSTRIGTYKCYQCRKQFTVKVGTVFEDSHVPLHIWLQAIFLLARQQKGHQQQPASRGPWASLSKPLGSCRTASAKPCAVGMTPMGGAGEIVEADETFIGRIDGENEAPRRFRSQECGSHSWSQRGGSARSFHVDGTTRRRRFTTSCAITSHARVR